MIKRKLFVVADCHVGNFRQFGGSVTNGINQRCAMTLESLQRAITKARYYSCSDFVVAGDLFDSDKPSPALIGAVADLFSDAVHYGLKVVVVVGNHDRTSSEENACMALTGIRGVRVISRPTADAGVIFLPVHTEPTGLCGDVIIAHHGIISQDTPAFLRGGDAKTLEQISGILEETQASLYLAGDWHKPAKYVLPYGVAIQIGTLSPTGFSDINITSGTGVVVSWSGNLPSFETVSIPSVAFVNNDLAVERAKKLEALAVYATATVTPKDGVTIKEDPVPLTTPTAQSAAYTPDLQGVMAAILTTVEGLPVSSELKSKILTMTISRLQEQT